MKKPLDWLPKPIRAFMISLLGKSVFQAGCREFESRLPLFSESVFRNRPGEPVQKN